MEEISFPEAWNLPKSIFIDLRTKSEYLKGTIPGAINLPLFDEDERNELGKTYVQICRQKAMFKGLEMSLPKIPSLLKKMSLFSTRGTVILFCQKGGLRSQSLFQMANLINIPIYKLREGYKGFRQYVLNYLNTFEMQGPLVTLHGLTGTGKTEILALLYDKGLPVIELERLACHRGSVFGRMGLKRQVGQKEFDALLWQDLVRYSDSPYLMIEGESKRIGNVYLPPFLLAERENGINILALDSLENRAKYITDEYLKNISQQDVVEEGLKALEKIQGRLIKRMGIEGLKYLQSLLYKEQFSLFVKEILKNYYDPLYNMSMKDISFHMKINTANKDLAAIQIEDFINNLSAGKILL